MTIRELYEWAEKHNALDLNLMKNIVSICEWIY